MAVPGVPKAGRFWRAHGTVLVVVLAAKCARRSNGPLVPSQWAQGRKVGMPRWQRKSCSKSEGGGQSETPPPPEKNPPGALSGAGGAGAGAAGCRGAIE